MEALTTKDLISLFDAMADAMEQHRDHLCELDGRIGDADHGVTMSMGFSAVREALNALDSTLAPTDVFNTAAKVFLNAVGASAGPLYATAFMRAGSAVKGVNDIDAASMSQIIQAMSEGIQFRGKAEPGDKTMLDAWLPASAAATAATDKGATLPELLSDVATAAQIGADSTVEMLAKKGRSAKLGPRSIGHMDAGAASAALLLAAMTTATSQ